MLLTKLMQSKWFDNNAGISHLLESNKCNRTYCGNDVVGCYHSTDPLYEVGHFECIVYQQTAFVHHHSP